MKDGNKIESKGYDIELRPHHVLVYPNYTNSDLNYFKIFRNVKGKFHSDELVKHWIKIIRSLHENPNLKFKYVLGMDSVCRDCEHKNECHDSKNKYYEFIKDEDQKAAKQMPQLKIGRIYDGNFLKKMFENR